MQPSGEYTAIETELDGPVLTLWLNRPQRLNAATPEMLDELVEVFDAADADDEVRVIVVTGRGRAFCAGADLVEDRPELSGVDRSDYRDGGGRVTLAVHRCRKPVIAAINGAAVGFGSTFTLPMDVRLASTEAKLGFVFARRGIVPEACSSWFLPRLVGMSRALEWITTGRLLGAAEAHSAGLVHALHEPEQLVGAAQALAREVADDAAPVSLAMARRMLWRMLDVSDPYESHLLESRMLYDRLSSADSQEGMNAFLEKRAARFGDRVSDGLPPELS
jgi:enoyl-CoA hydratase/carnithine racemase